MKKKRGGTGARRGAAWRGSRERMSPALLALIALLGAALAAGGLFLQRARSGDAAAELAPGLQINELMSDNVTALLNDAGSASDWIELRNAGREPLRLKGYSLVLGSEVNKIFSFPDSTLAPGACALVYAEGMDAGAAHGDWSAPFRLPASGGVELTLLSPGDRVVDSVLLPELAQDQAYARDDGGAWALRSGGTPGADNSASQVASSREMQLAPGELEISEVSSANTLYFPDESGACHDYIEIHNTSSQDVNLSGWHLSDDSGRLQRWGFPSVTLPAGGYLAVHCSGLDRTDDAQHLHTDFQLGAEESAFLSRPDGQLVSTASPGELLTDQAWSLVDGAWSAELAPTPGMENTPEAAARVNAQRFGAAQVRISELMASASGEPYDWIELHNPTGQPVDLSGWGLSDDPGSPRKWRFPQGTALQPGEYLGIFASGMREERINDYLNASFSLSAAGGCTVTLSDPQGSVLDAAYLPEQYRGVSYGRAEGEEGFFYFESGTPNAANAGAHYRGRAREPVCSASGGLFAPGDSFQVEIEAPQGCRVYYTLDGSDPSESSTPYAGPVPISGSAILRARAFRDGYMPSLIDTRSYLYGVENPGGFYVVSLVSDPNNLTGASGVLAEANLQRDLEREAHVELFTPEGAAALCQGCGISLHGMDSRSMPVKSFNVIARSGFEANRFNYPIFSGRDYQSYHSFLLRPSGEDQNISFMRDTALSSLMEGSSVLYQMFEPALVYLNGEYYTLCYLRERINKYSVCQFEGWEGMEDEIDLVRGNSTVLVGSNESFEELLSWVKSNDMATDAAYAYLDAHIDIQNYIEYMAMQIFSGNSDTLNVRRYRNAGADGKWRWALFDLDWAFFNDVNSIGQWLTPGGVGVANATDNTLFIACMSNPTFRDRFLSHMGQQLNGSFSTENVVAHFQAHRARIEPSLAQFAEKWGFRTLNDGYKKLVAYAQERPRKLIGYFRSSMKLSDADLERYFGDAIRRIQDAGKGEG